jgi:hypothetical protein
MRTILSVGRHRRVVRIGMFVIAAALITGMVGCQGAPSYVVTISSTEGGSVTAPGEGVFSYRFCMDVDLVATPDSGYRFVKWLGDLASIADVNSATTTISVTRGNYHITAMFERIAPIKYNLIISSTAGGSVAVPGEGLSTYDMGAVVDLVASPDDGYEFQYRGPSLLPGARYLSASLCLSGRPDGQEANAGRSTELSSSNVSPSAMLT